MTLAHRWVGLTVSLVSLAGIAYWASRQRAPEIPAVSDAAGPLALALGAYAVAMLLRGERWWRLLDHNGGRLGRADATGLTFVGYMGNTVLPARAGDAMRAVLGAPRAGVTVRMAIGTMITERLADATTLFALFVVLAYGVLRGIEAPDALGVIAALVALLALVAILIALTRAAPGGGLWSRVATFAAPMAEATRRLRGRHLADIVVLTVLIWTAEAGTYWAVSDVVGLQMSALEALYLVSLASVFGLIPSGPGYLGTMDAAVLFATRAIGAPGNLALSYLIVLRLVLFVPVVLVGGVLALTRYGGWRAVRAVV